MTLLYDMGTTSKDSLLPSGVTTAPLTGCTLAATSPGLSVTSTSATPPAFTFTDPQMVSLTAEGQWITIQMSASAGERLGFYCGVGAGSDQRFCLPIRADGVMRTYNLWTGKHYIIPRTLADVNATPDPAYSGFTGAPAKILLHKALAPETAITLTSRVLTAGSANVALAAANSGIMVGQTVAGTGIAVGTTVAAYDAAAKTITLSQPAVTSGTVTLTLQAGFMSPVTVYCSEVPGASAVVGYIQIDTQPTGPANLVVEFFGPAIAMTRVGVPNAWGIRVRNMGGITATGIALAFSSTEGLTVGTPRGLAQTIPPDEDRTFFFDVTASSASNPLDMTTFKHLQVTVTCAQGDSNVVTGRAWVDPAAPSGLTTGTAPTAVAISRANKRATIGLWNFQAWSAYDEHHSASICSTFERRSALGIYDQEDPAVCDWFIYWLAAHGVDYLNVEWFELLDTAPRYLALGLTQSKNIGAIKFQISYCSNDNVTLPNNRIQNGVGIFAGTGAPTAGVGNQNDFYLDVTNWRIYGWKGASAWPSGYVQCMTPSQATAGDAAISFSTVSTTGTWSSGSPDITVASTANLYVGMPVVGTGLAANSVATAINIATKVVTVNHNATSSGAAVSLSFTKVDPRVIFACGFLNMARKWLPFVSHSSYHRTPDNRLRISVFNAFLLYEHLNNIKRSSDAGRYTAVRTAFMSSLLDLTETLVLASVSAAGVPAAGVAWCGQIQNNQGGADGDGLTTGGTGNSTRFTDMGFYRADAYNWYQAGNNTNGCVNMTAAQSIDYARDHRWSAQCNNNGCRPAANLMAGFDNGRWVQPRTPDWVLTGWSYEMMKRHLQDCLAWLDANVSATQTDEGREILIDALDEHGEGSIVMPNARDQFTMTRAIAEVFVLPSVFGGGYSWPQGIIVPEDVSATTAHVTDLYSRPWVQALSAVPSVDGSSTITEQGITIPPGSYPTPSRIRGGGWIRHH